MSFFRSFPFDRHSVYGFFYYSFVGYICVYHYCGLLIVYGQFFLGICYYLNAFCQDFTFSIRNIDKLHHEYVEKGAGPSPRERIEFDCALNKEICGAVDFQGEIIE